MNGTLKAFLDRLFFSASYDKRFKVGAAVVSARRMGTTATLDQMNKYFLHGEMPVAASRYWNAVHGNSPEEVMYDAPVTNTMLEGINNKIKVMKRRAYGYRDEEYFKLLLLGLHDKTNAIRG